jgi:uncharacterized damage-inducible protein DinB
MTPEHLRLLCEYNAWANHRSLDACAGLSAEQFTRDFGSSFPWVRDTLAHTLGAEWVWLERVQGRSPAALPPSREFPDLADVQDRWAEVERGLLETTAKLAELNRVVAYRNIRGNRFAYPLHQVLRHVVNHGTYHWGQVTAMLRQLGVTPVATDLIVYFREKSGKATDGAMDLETTRFLYEFNVWASHRLLDACETLSDDQFTRDLGSSFGSVRGTLAHIFAAEWLWLERWRGRSPAGLLHTDVYANLADLRKNWAEFDRELLGFVNGLSPADLVRVHDYRTTKGAPSTNALWQMLQHVVNHGTYHRGQVATLLRQLGARPRATDLLRYLDVLAGQPED